MKIFFVMTLAIFSSCSHQVYSNADKTVAKRAMYDFNCDVDKINVISLGDEKFKASGCDQQATYTLQCALGPCNAIKVD